MKVRISDVVVRTREIRLPDACPGCGLAVGEATVNAVGLDWNFGDDVTLPVCGDFPRGEFTVEPTGYACARCGHLLAWGELAVIEAPDPKVAQATIWSRSLDKIVLKGRPV